MTTAVLVLHCACCTPLCPGQEISLLCRSRGLALHLDGARLFNAFVECGYGPQVRTSGQGSSRAVGC